MPKKFIQMGYDFDTAMGNNNEGYYIERKPGLEDTDILGVKADGTPDYVFNGQESVLHINERDGFFDDICSIAQTVYSNSQLTADMVNKRMDDFQEAWPERMYNRDCDDKYYQSKADLNRAHGSKRTSRTKWLNDQFEYKMGQYKFGNANKVQAHFRAYARGTLTITRLKDGYINVLYASTPARIRATHNIAYPMEVTLGNLNDAEVGLYQVKYIKAIEGIPDMYPGDVDLNACESLEEIILGKEDANYENTHMTTNDFSGCRRAKKIVLNGCTNVTGTLEVPDLYRIEYIDTRRTGINGYNLMANGPLKKLYAGNSLNTLKLVGMRSLETLSIPNPSNLTFLWVEDCDFDVVDALNYIKVMPTGSRVRLIGLDIEASTATEVQAIYDDLNRMTGIDHNGSYVNSPKECVSGTVHITNTSDHEIAILENQFPYMSVTGDYVKRYADIEPNAYGVQWDYSKSYTALDRTGLSVGFVDPSPATSVSETGSSPFDNIAPWKDMKVYNVVGDTFIEKGASGFDMEANDTVVYIPEFYFKATKDTTNHKWTWAISSTPLDGYTKHPGSGRYVGRYHTGGSASGVYTKSGVLPLVNTDQPSFRTYSHNKGANWYMMDIDTWSAIQMLYLVEFANFDSQTVLGKGFVSSVVGTMGATDNALYHTIKATTNHNQYRWIEDPFSNCVDWIDGYVGSTSEVYIGHDNSTFTGGTSGLTKTSLRLPNVQNEKYCITGFGYDSNNSHVFVPDTSVTNVNYNTYVCDDVDSSGSLFPAIVGGACSGVLGNGFFRWDSWDAPSSSYPGLGSRLFRKP